LKEQYLKKFKELDSKKNQTQRRAIVIAKEETRDRIEGKRRLLKEDGEQAPPSVPTKEDIEKEDLEKEEENDKRLFYLHQTQDKLDKVDNRKKRRLDLDLDVFGTEVLYRSFKRRRVKSDKLYDQEEYEKQKEKLGEETYTSQKDLSYGQEDKVDPKRVDEMVNELKSQEVRRSKFSRRRPWLEDSDIDYINERNRKFNLKAERAYGKYTQQIKESLERGTSL